MSLARLTFYALWIAPVPLLALVAMVMRSRRLDRQFPAFFAYCLFGVLRTPILLFVFHRTTAYFYCYYAAEVVSAVLGLAAIYEVFLSLFPGYDTDSRLAQSLFRWVGAALVVAAVIAAIAAPGSDENPLMAASLVVTRSVRMVQCGLLLFLFVASSYLGLSWRSHVLGVAVGFGLFVAAEMAAVAMRAQAGLISQDTFSFVKQAAYNCSVLVWLAYFLAPQPAEQLLPIPRTVEMESWNRALSQLLQR
jgi:hypothetical protein